MYFEKFKYYAKRFFTLVTFVSYVYSMFFHGILQYKWKLPSYIFIFSVEMSVKNSLVGVSFWPINDAESTWVSYQTRRLNHLKISFSYFKTSVWISLEFQYFSPMDSTGIFAVTYIEISVDFHCELFQEFYKIIVLRKHSKFSQEFLPKLNICLDIYPGNSLGILGIPFLKIFFFWDSW